jgi:hypothetical protein
MSAVLMGMGVTLAALVVQGLVTVLGFETVSALLTRRAVGTSLWRNGLVTVMLIMILWVGHLAQMTVWATLFFAVGEFETFGPAFYHSAVNYTTLGYGDIVMSPRWRLLGPQEAACGSLAFGWSTAAIVTIVIRLVRFRHRSEEHDRTTKMR